MGRRTDRDPGFRGRACTDPAPSRRCRRGASDAVQPRAPGTPGTAKNRRFSTGPKRADHVRAQLVRQAVLGAFRGLVQGDVRDPGRPRAADRLDGERDEPLAAQSPRVGRRQAHVLHERLDARDRLARSRLCSGSAPGRNPGSSSFRMRNRSRAWAPARAFAFAASGAVGSPPSSPPQAGEPDGERGHDQYSELRS